MTYSIENTELFVSCLSFNFIEWEIRNDLSQSFNKFYNEEKIIGSDNETARLVLTQATGQVLKNGLKLLGIEAPERM